MCTDIHWVMETRKGPDEPWVGILASDFCDTPAGDRFYAFFAEFGVGRAMFNFDESKDYQPRLDGRGLPEDRSALARDYNLVGDHSFTWTTLTEFYDAYAKALLAAGRDADPQAMFGPGFHWWYFMASDGHGSCFECRLIIGFDS